MMELTRLEADDVSLRAGYVCPCGCTPVVQYRRGDDLVEEGCCCGNHFAIGPQAAAGIALKVGYRRELQEFDAPWGERLQAAWLVGPSAHGPDGELGHDHAEGHGPAADRA